MPRGYWTCQRTTDGEVCKALNSNRRRKCTRCGKPRPTRKQPAHMRVLEQPYEVFVAINGGDWCGICGKEPTPMRKLDRDHDHTTGLARGLLCWRHNKLLGQNDWTPETLRAAADYLERRPGMWAA